MRYIKFLFWGAVALVVIVLAMANRDVVTVRLLPEELTAVFKLSGSISIPLFLVIIAGVVAGLLIGFVWEWLREYKIRRDLGRSGKQIHKLEREVKVLKAKTGEGADDVLALIE